VSQQEVMQFMTEFYGYEKENRLLTIHGQDFTLHITKNSFELHEERHEKEVNYMNQVSIEEDLHVEMIRSFNFKEIGSKELLRDCVDHILSYYVRA
jgi:hypothetical protein